MTPRGGCYIQIVKKSVLAAAQILPTASPLNNAHVVAIALVKCASRSEEMGLAAISQEDSLHNQVRKSPFR